MERKIEFRGKSKKDNEWHYGSLFIDDNYGGGYDYYIEYMLYGSLPYRHSERVIGESVGQYTGIKDKNGKEIYEGDILFYKFKSYLLGEDRGTYYIVKYEDGMFCICIKEYNEKEGKEEWIEDDRLCKSLIEVDKLEVIGNIYDNKELIEKSS